MKILFVCKKRGSYGYLSSGLLNSVKFVTEMLNDMGVEAKMVEVTDNNSIDAEVTRFKPTHVIIEAFWVVPEKFDVLMPLHPDVTWIVRNHSDIPFLANEGIAFEWMFEYLERGVRIASNKPATVRDLSRLLRTHVQYLPNYYPVTHTREPHFKLGDHLNIGCFGAVRPLKNQLMQALAAIEFADEHNKRLRFHMNVGRIEMNGDPIIKNIRALFANLPRHHELIEHPWLDHDKFIALAKKMDLGMQVTFSETYNIVSADLVNLEIPIVVSPEVHWANQDSWADPSSIEDMVLTLNEVCEHHKTIIKENKKGLMHENADTICAWWEFITND